MRDTFGEMEIRNILQMLNTKPFPLQCTISAGSIHCGSFLVVHLLPLLNSGRLFQDSSLETTTFGCEKETCLILKRGSL